MKKKKALRLAKISGCPFFKEVIMNVSKYNEINLGFAKSSTWYSLCRHSLKL